jgi:hypothetical protein
MYFFFIGSIEKKLCYPERFYLVVLAATSTPKKFQKIINFNPLWNISRFASEALVHSMLINEVNNGRKFVLQPIITS